MRKRFRDRDWSDPNWQTKLAEFEQTRNRNKVTFGIVLAVIGLIWVVFIKFNIDFNIEDNWPLVLFVIGLLSGLKSNFRNNAWWILWLIGGSWYVHQYWSAYDQYIFPAVLIVVGIWVAVRPRKLACKPTYNLDESINANNNLNIDVVFGGRKEMITSREFIAGDINLSFGGCELNFMQAEMAGDSAVLDLRVSFGGVEIAVPSHWQIRNEVRPAFGSVEDERQLRTNVTNENTKTLILRGTCSFGSVEIKSY